MKKLQSPTITALLNPLTLLCVRVQVDTAPPYLGSRRRRKAEEKQTGSGRSVRPSVTAGAPLSLLTVFGWRSSHYQLVWISCFVCCQTQRSLCSASCFKGCWWPLTWAVCLSACCICVAEECCYLCVSFQTRDLHGAHWRALLCERSAWNELSHSTVDVGKYWHALHQLSGLECYLRHITLVPIWARVRSYFWTDIFIVIYLLCFLCYLPKFRLCACNPQEGVQCLQPEHFLLMIVASHCKCLNKKMKKKYPLLCSVHCSQEITMTSVS